MHMSLRSSFRVAVRSAQIQRSMRENAHRRVGQAVAHLDRETKKTLSGNRSGRWYRVPSGSSTRARRRPRRGRRYRAAGPGEPPAVRTGALRNSIAHTRPTRVPGTDTVTASWGSRGLRPPYGRFLETRRKEALRHPFLAPTARREAGAVAAILSRGWDAL